MIHLEDGTIKPVEKSELPITLPEDIDLNSNGNPLENHKTWKYTTDKISGKKAIRETDTLDTFVDSSWYFLRFCSPNTQSPHLIIQKLIIGCQSINISGNRACYFTFVVFSIFYEKYQLIK